ncbi:hypothetical protein METBISCDRAFT_28265 [Metschnikowia bicuspidata]|uniref:Karyogamy protein n=1 Tax=Metschnikowia bicuspidata TaxID=27322 RepID=A0A4P9ZBI2_9ASCO|nr:hypothetical protein METBISCDRAFT_28265 [Metschnikowia bicuspidata]
MSTKKPSLLTWVLEEPLWLSLLDRDHTADVPELLKLRIENTAACLLPHLQRLVGELQQHQGSERSVQWYCAERAVVLEVAVLFLRFDNYLKTVFEWCIKLEGLKLCPQLKSLMLRMVDAQQLLVSLKRKCNTALRYLEIADVELLAVQQEVDGCAAQLHQIRTLQMDAGRLPRCSLEEAFETIRLNHISHLCSHSARLASPSVFSGTEGEVLRLLESLALRMDALGFSMVLLRQQVADFRNLSGQIFPKCCLHLQQQFQALETKWDAVQADYTTSTTKIWDANRNALFRFLIDETLRKIRNIARGSAQQDAPALQGHSMDLKLCSGVINFVRNAFREEMITLPELTFTYNDVLTQEWELLSQQLIELADTEKRSLPSQLKSPFDEDQLLNTPTRDSLHDLVLPKAYLPKDTPGTTPLHTPEVALTPASTSAKKPQLLLGLGLNLDIYFHQTFAVPLSVVKRDRIRLLSPTEKESTNSAADRTGGTNLTKKFRLVSTQMVQKKLGPPVTFRAEKPGPASRRPALLEQEKSRIPTMVADHHMLNYPYIEQLDARGSRIPMIFRARAMPERPPSASNSDGAQEMPTLYSSLRTPPCFNLGGIRFTSTPRLAATEPSCTAANFCLGLVTPDNSLGFIPERHSTPEVLQWGSRPQLLRRTSVAPTPGTKLQKRPWR